MNELQVGVLIIGSLYWDTTCHRDRWRSDRLNLNGQRYVSAPIRYGRQSHSRGDSYTMVFSLSLIPDRLGRAIVVPCARTARSASDLVDEAVCLWTAETGNGGNEEGRLSSRNGWGRVALLPNPQRSLPDDLRTSWTNRVSSESGYGKDLTAASGEHVSVDDFGFLRIPWPQTEDGSDLNVDVLLATATTPTINNEGSYPTVQKITDAWIDATKHAEYFHRNRKHGIRTFQDADISARLQADEESVPQ